MGPEPIVISPLSSTSWHTTALEWMVNLSRLSSVFSPGLGGRGKETSYMGAITEVSGKVAEVVDHEPRRDTR